MRFFYFLLFLNFQNAFAGNYAVGDKDIQGVNQCLKVPSISQLEEEIREIYSQERTLKSKKISVFDLDGMRMQDSTLSELQDLHWLTYEVSTYHVTEKIQLNEKHVAMKRVIRQPMIETQTGRTSYSLREFQARDKNCHEVICATKLIFGAREGVKILWAYKKHHLNLSRYQYKFGTDFSEEELDAAILAFLAVPKHLAKAVANGRDGFFRHQSGYRSPAGVNPVANAFGAIFDPIEKRNFLSKIYTFFHEMSHRMSEYGRRGIDNTEPWFDQTSEWLSVGGWIKKDEQFESSRKDFISQYAMSNPVEDFAETVTAYRYAPERLKSVAPHKYDYVRKYLFDGRDYSTTPCDLTQPLQISKLQIKPLSLPGLGSNQFAP